MSNAAFQGVLIVPGIQGVRQGHGLPGKCHILGPEKALF